MAKSKSVGCWFHLWNFSKFILEILDRKFDRNSFYLLLFEFQIFRFANFDVRTFCHLKNCDDYEEVQCRWWWRMLRNHIGNFHPFFTTQFINKLFLLFSLSRLLLFASKFNNQHCYPRAKLFPMLPLQLLPRDWKICSWKLHALCLHKNVFSWKYFHSRER